ncbi:MAG: transketolase C-terminal domain-containing protein [Pseudomonadota bacterium]
MRDAFIARLTEHAKADRDIVLVTGDLGFGVLTDFAKNYPEQFINAGVAEQNMTGLATGLALAGKTVFTYSIANFPILRCLEQIRNDAAYHDANVNVVAIGGGFSYGALGMSHHATEDLAIMRALPQVTVLSPGCLWETEEITSALPKIPGACYFRLDKSHAGRTGREGEKLEIGKARQLREGSDVTLLTTGGILGEAIACADSLASKGVTCDLFSYHTISPFDEQSMLSSLEKTGCLVTLEEHVLTGGLGSIAAEVCLDASVYPKKSKRLGITGGYCSKVGDQNYLRGVYGLTAADVEASILQTLKG